MRCAAVGVALVALVATAALRRAAGGRAGYLATLACGAHPVHDVPDHEGARDRCSRDYESHHSPPRVKYSPTARQINANGSAAPTGRQSNASGRTIWSITGNTATSALTSRSHSPTALRRAARSVETWGMWPPDMPTIRCRRRAGVKFPIGAAPRDLDCEGGK